VKACHGEEEEEAGSTPPPHSWWSLLSLCLLLGQLSSHSTPAVFAFYIARGVLEMNWKDGGKWRKFV